MDILGGGQKVIENSAHQLEEVEKLKKLYYDPKEPDISLVFTYFKNKRQLKVELKRGFDWIITAEKGNPQLRVLGLDPNKNFSIPHKPGGFTVIRRYQPPNREIFKNQEIQLVAREPILYDTYDIKLEEGDLLEQIELKLSEAGLSDEV
ncbi:hypothetical protein AVEN_251354-1 [Araneus ventricosus]|uniref:Uncharacterized protein n=1 Tax=Araneus ventricosus TaxID=182803 RepID=A0A4Y2T202_ARAVE|nr:hypothetical protein AVEN_251354-1 [Araneus ventricosus]